MKTHLRSWTAVAGGVALVTLITLRVASGPAAAQGSEPAAPKAAAPTGTLALTNDVAHSEVGFNIQHIVSRVHGKFDKFKADISFDPKNLAATQVQAEIDANSIDTGVEKRDNHLRSADFFDVTKFPTLTFKSTKVEPVDATHAKMTGDLTIKGITNHVVAKGTLTGPATGLAGNTVIGLALETVIDRTQYGLTWNADLPSGGPVLANDVKIVVEAELAKVEA